MSRKDTGTIVVSADPHAKAASAVTEEQKAILQTVLDQLGLDLINTVIYHVDLRRGSHLSFPTHEMQCRLRHAGWVQMFIPGTNGAQSRGAIF